MTEYTNTLDQWYGSCPGPVQTVLQWPYQQISEILQWLTGEPNTIAAQCTTYATQGQTISGYATTIAEIKNSMTGWSGGARNAFDAKMDQLGGNFEQLGQAVGSTQEILVAAAETCVEASNMVIDIVKMVIEFLLTSLAVAMATAVFTFGASVAAWIASNLANGARALAQIMNGLAKVAQVLHKIAGLLEKLARAFTKVAEVLRNLKALLQALKQLQKGAGFGTKLYLRGLAAAASQPVVIGANGLIAGAEAATGRDLPNMPGGAGEGVDAAQSGAGAVGAGNRAQDAADRNRPPGH
ncbi:hypothetical protein GC722_10245 [Auraticoccus sp. F435]|uniref:WXG100 family type VII secretion target n=1 Tax=Auraticoccus cholistanensis TaxID=2656650 RepID=A0A6A9V134_9ACTN|nr:hypothetical protein [Auraticoccus cholistanensis]MVA76400.1 hypothetical protein [Auraticoccus cholistanensis]